MPPAPSSVVTLEGVGKRYVKYEDAPMLLTGLLRRGRRRPRGSLWAVRDVSLDVAGGEAVGVIGRNGSGKSTLLTMVAGVTAPTEGTVRVTGRVAPLLQVGVGFHSELTGRENVYVNATVLGLKRREVDAVLDQIVEFAELSEFIDAPVKFYSSGMRVRLGFATAVAVRPDVLLVDEVLAVGDIAFQMKCYERMMKLKNAGTSFLVVSHDLDAIHRICDSVLVLDEGTPRFVGSTGEAITFYHQLVDSDAPGTGGLVPETAPVRVVGFELLDDEGRSVSHVTGGQEVTFRLRLRCVREVANPGFGLQIRTASGQLVSFESTAGQDTGRFAEGDEVVCDMCVGLALVTGSYQAGAVVKWGVETGEGVELPAKLFHLSGRPFIGGVADLGCAFRIAAGGPPD